MTVFQIILLIVVVALFLTSLLAMFQGWAARRAAAVWAVLFGIGIPAVIWPDATTRIAHAVGINEGKSLLLYCAVVFMLVGFFMTYMRLRAVRRDLTLLVRALAQQTAVEGGADSSEESDRGMGDAAGGGGDTGRDDAGGGSDG